VQKVSRYGRLVVIALLLVGMLIGSAIASTVMTFNPIESQLWDLIFRIAYLGYVFSMIMAGLIVLRLVWRWMRGKDPVGD
jgi:amino acid transporter